MATPRRSTMSRRRPPKSAAYVDPDETISVASDDDRTITDIDEDDKDDKPVIVHNPIKKCSITYIINDDDDDDKAATMSDMAQHYIGSTAAKPILVDDDDSKDKAVAAVPAPRAYHLRPRIKAEPVDDTAINVKIKKEFDPVADAKLMSSSSVLHGSQVDGLPLVPPPQSPKEEDKPEQEQASEKDKLEPVAIAEEQEQPLQEESAPSNPPQDLFGDVDVDDIDIDSFLQDTMNQQDFFSMDSVNAVDNMDSIGSMQTYQNGASVSFPPPTKENPPVPSCEAQFTALGDDWLDKLAAGSGEVDSTFPTAATDAATDNNGMLGTGATSVGEDTATLVGTPEPHGKDKDPAVVGDNISTVAASDFEELFAALDDTSSPDKHKDKDKDTQVAAPSDSPKDSLAAKAAHTPTPAGPGSGKESTIEASTSKYTATEETATEKEVSAIEDVPKDKAVDTSVATEVEDNSANNTDNEQGQVPGVTAARDDPSDAPVDVDAMPATSVPHSASQPTKAAATKSKNVTKEMGEDADKSKDSAPVAETESDIDAGPSAPASVPTPPDEVVNPPEMDEANKVADNNTAPNAKMEVDTVVENGPSTAASVPMSSSEAGKAPEMDKPSTEVVQPPAPAADMEPGMEPGMEPVVKAGPSAPTVSPIPPALPDISPEDAVATQLASALGLVPEQAPLQEQEPAAAPQEPEEPLFGEEETPQKPDAAPLGDDQEDPEPMDIDPPADATGAAANNEESVFVDPHPVVDQEDLELDIEDVENGFSLEGPGYAWKDIDTMPQGRGIRVLEESVASGIELGRKVIDTLSKGDPDTRIHTNRWKKEFASICEANDNFQVLVGVSGSTGAGKTTLINALMDTNELLPSGSHGAATATVCRVHQAKEPDAPPFRAVVTFKTKKGMREWLGPILGDVADYYAWKDAEEEKALKKKAKKGLGGADSDDDDSDEDDFDEDDSESDEDDNDDDEDYVPGQETAQQREDRAQKKKQREEKQKAKAAKREEKEKKRREKEAKKAEEEGDDDPFDKQAVANKLRSVEGIFRRNLDHLRGWTLKDLLNKDLFPIVKLVGKTKTIVGDDHETFSDAIKPFLDSTPIPDGYDYDAFDGNENGECVGEDDDDEEEEEEEEEEEVEEEEGKGDGGGNENGDDDGEEEGGEDDDEEEEIVCTEDKVMWPIVDHVDIYLKHAPLLANGVVLADLPGLADANEDRAAIAKACFDRLDITMIVAPANRAGDDATAADLLSDIEEVRLRLTNRLNKRSFCVIASKTDDLCDWETYLKKTVIPQPGSLLEYHVGIYSELKSQLAAVNEKLRETDEKIEELVAERDVEKQSGTDETGDTLRVLGMEVVEMKEFITALTQRQKNLEAWLDYYQGLLAFRTNEYRNNIVREKVQNTFLRKTAAAREKAEILMEMVAQRKEKAKKAAEAQKVDPPADLPANAPVDALVDAPAGPPPKAPDAPDVPVVDATPDNAKPHKAPDLIDVLLVSADAYRKIRKSDGRRRNKDLKEGFPAASFTGVPAARAWIRASTIPLRRSHATTLLMRLSVLLHEFKTGFGEAPAPLAASFSSQSEDVDMDANVGADAGAEASAPMPVQAAQVADNPVEAVREILMKFKELLAGNLGNSADRLEVQAIKCNPMTEAAFNQPAVAPARTAAGKGDKDGAAVKYRKPQFRPTCRNEIMEGVKSWQYRNMMKNGLPRGATARKVNKDKGGKKDIDPAKYATTWLTNVKGNVVRMPWATHAAIIRRRGGPYVSTGKIPGAYMWMRNMTGLVLADVVGYWEMSLHGRLPNEVEVARGLMMDAWGRAVSRLRARLPPYFSGEKEARLRQHLSAILAIRDCCVDAAQRAMEEVAEQSKGVAILVEGILDKGWKKVFEQALQMSGKGVFNARQTLMECHARENTQPLVKKAMLSMDAEYRNNVKKFRETLDEIREDGLVQVEQQVNAIMQLVVGEGDAALANRPKLDDRARRIHHIVRQWEGDWKSPDASTKMDVDVESTNVNGSEDRNSGVSSIDEGSTAMPTEYIPVPVDQPSLETLLPKFKQFNEGDGNEDGDGEDALDKELMIVPDSKPKRGTKRKAADDGGKGKAPAKKRKPAAPKKPAAKGATRGRGGGKAAAGKAAANKAGGAKGSRGGKGGGRGGRGGGRGRGKT